jgi:hypothetical protein
MIPKHAQKLPKNVQKLPKHAQKLPENMQKPLENVQKLPKNGLSTLLFPHSCSSVTRSSRNRSASKPIDL